MYGAAVKRASGYIWAVRSRGQIGWRDARQRAELNVDVIGVRADSLHGVPREDGGAQEGRFFIAGWHFIAVRGRVRGKRYIVDVAGCWGGLLAPRAVERAGREFPGDSFHRALLLLSS